MVLPLWRSDLIPQIRRRTGGENYRDVGIQSSPNPSSFGMLYFILKIAKNCSPVKNTSKVKKVSVKILTSDLATLVTYH